MTFTHCKVNCLPCVKHLTQFKMADQVFAWIKSVALLNDESLKEEINLVHQSSLKAFAIAISKIQRPTETHTLQDGILG